jgi:predicted phage terminase large subunit-like protein
MSFTTDEVMAVLRQDFYAFIEQSFYELNPETPFLRNWHIQLIAAKLEACRRGEIKRLIINVPPRSLKSLCTSVAFVAWLLGHNPSEQIVCVSYSQELSNKHAMDCRTVMLAPWYLTLFPTRLSSERQAVPEFKTTRQGVRLSTSVGGVMTGRGADFIIIDDPLKPEEAFSDLQRQNVNDWFDHTLISRLNDKQNGCIIVITQRLHEDDLVGHLLGQGGWTLLRLPATAEEDEEHVIDTPYGQQRFVRLAGEALHPEREPLETLENIKLIQGEYNFAGQYQQQPAPLGGGMVKKEWFLTYTPTELPPKFEMVFQSWDTANKPSELSDHSACTTFGVKGKHLYLLNVLRKRMGYPDLKRAVREQAQMFGPKIILIEDKASGTQLIQELTNEGLPIKRYDPKMDKIMRMHSVTNTIENGLVHIPDKALWLAAYVHELTTFPKGKYDDQADATSQALDWFKQGYGPYGHGLLELWAERAAEAKRKAENRASEVAQWQKDVVGFGRVSGARSVAKTNMADNLTQACPQCGNPFLAKQREDKYTVNWQCNRCGLKGQDKQVQKAPGGW